MPGMMDFILRTSTGDEVVKSLHLGGHVLHLGVHYPDRLFVDRFGGCLDSGVVLVDRLYDYVSAWLLQHTEVTYSPVLLHLAF